MKLITLITKSNLVADLAEAFDGTQFLATGMTVIEVRGLGRQRAIVSKGKEGSVQADLIPKIKVLSWGSVRVKNGPEGAELFPSITSWVVSDTARTVAKRTSTDLLGR